MTDVNEPKLRLRVARNAPISGVVIERRVLAQDIERQLATQHDVRLLTVPAMRSGTPGAPKQDFKVYAVSERDEVTIFNSYADY